ncbi:MAG: hypothetical protein IJW70_05520 [Clostridia bacterium]|nr:hypothetical protein [Clostridia bacterium]
MRRTFALTICILLIITMLGCTPNSSENNEHTSTEAEIFESTQQEPTEAEIALEMYDAAVKGKIRVNSEYQGEIELKDCLLPGLLKKMEDSLVDQKAIIDLDMDGICEYVIQSSLGDCVVLHYFDGKVYAYTFSFRNFSSLRTDGTYFWYQTKDGGLTYGASKLRFEGSEMIEESVFTVIEANEQNDAVFYIGEREVDEQEYKACLAQTCKDLVEYLAFEAPWQKTITKSKALKIAEDYWDIKSGDVDAETGYQFALIPKYCETGNYLIALSWLVEGDHYSTLDVIEIDAFTGEIIPQE